MKEGGALAGQLRKKLATMVRPGIKTMALEEEAKSFYEAHGVKPSFLGYHGYPHRIVVCVNEEVVHGMPSDRVINKGDIVTVDLGIFHKGYHTDTAETVEAGTDSWSGFLNIGRIALEQAIGQCRAGNYVGDISYAMQSVVESHGCNVIRAFVGHGIGEKLHEDIQVPCFGYPKDGIELTAGMTLAVEVMYVEKKHHVRILDDGWTAVTKDGGRSAMFEHTIAITEGEPLILTA